MRASTTLLTMARAYGGSGIAGLIRQGELTHGIPHALAAAIDPKAHNRNGPGGKAFVWPASSADGDSSTAYGTTGNLFMGTLVAIPPSVDLGELGLRGPEMEIARALQDYGAYVVELGRLQLPVVCRTQGQGRGGSGRRRTRWPELLLPPQIGAFAQDRH